MEDESKKELQKILRQIKKSLCHSIVRLLRLCGWSIDNELYEYIYKLLGSISGRRKIVNILRSATDRINTDYLIENYKDIKSKISDYGDLSMTIRGKNERN